jgi:hypothetical protein
MPKFLWQSSLSPFTVHQLHFVTIFDTDIRLLAHGARLKSHFAVRTKGFHGYRVSLSKKTKTPLSKLCLDFSGEFQSQLPAVHGGRGQHQGHDLSRQFLASD